MSSGSIASDHVQKLGHRLQEIRERALNNIVSKLQHGFIYDDDLARSKEILSKLFDWFSFDDPTYQETVLRLMTRILKSDSGSALIRHYGPKTVASEIARIRTKVDSRYHPIIDELLTYTCRFTSRVETPTMVPPLRDDRPLSYRTQESERPKSTSTTKQHTKRDSDTKRTVRESIKSQISNPNTDKVDVKWMLLTRTDLSVIRRLESSLRNPSEPVALLDVCEFFRDIVLQDYPAEVFLQRPAVVQLLHGYLKSSTSTRLSNGIFECLLKLTECLIVRINACGDPCICNRKRYERSESDRPQNYPFVDSSPSSTERSYMRNIGLENLCDDYEDENLELLKNCQLTVSQFCVYTIDCIFEYVRLKPALNDIKLARRKNLFTTHSALVLLDRIFDLLETSKADLPDDFEQSVLSKFADALEYFRVEVVSVGRDPGASSGDRLVHLRLLKTCSEVLTKFVSLTMADTVIPRSLKVALSNALLDSAFARLYTSVHETILQYVEKFDGQLEADSMIKFREVETVCKSMSAAVRLFKTYKSLSAIEAVKFSRDSVGSLEFHRNFRLLAIVIDILAEKLSLCRPESFDIAQETILSLLAHGDCDVQEESYRLCHSKVVGAIGTRSGAPGSIGKPGSQVVFLLSPTVLIEMSAHGLRHEKNQIKRFADEILIHVLKCKILVSDEIWNRTVQALIPSLPILTCHAGKKHPLGRAIVELLDPDRASDLKLPALEVLKANLRLLFVDDDLTRTEAVSRLCWMLASQENSRNLLPRLNTLQDKDLSSIFRFSKVGGIDVNKARPSQHYYQPSSLVQVLDLLESKGVEPVIRRSALKQASVMLEDQLLHRTLTEHGGVRCILAVMKSALVENSYDDYVDCVISAVSALKSVCLYGSMARQELSNDAEVYYYVLRGLFIFSAEERVRRDCATLLFVLTFHEYVWGNPAKGDLSLPAVVIDSLLVPFVCKTHWRTSKHMPSAFAVSLLCDKWCMSSLQIHWNSEWFGGFDKILNWNGVKYSETDLSQFDSKLRLNEADLFMLKNSSLDYCIAKCLSDIQNGTCHGSVIESICKLRGYLNLYISIGNKTDSDKKEICTSFQWEYTFVRFLSTPPANEEDALLLISCIRVMIILVPLYKFEDKSCWIASLLKDSTHCLPNLLQTTDPSSEFKFLRKELLNLIITCVKHEHNFFDLRCPRQVTSTSGDWVHLVGLLADNLRAQRFEPTHDLMYLDCTLGCLTHLTSTLGWSGSVGTAPPKEPVPTLVSYLCELVGVFYGAGSVETSHMGASITRHVFLVLNHLIAEMQFFGTKNWEMCFFGGDAFERGLFAGINALFSSSDVVLRAGVWQLLGCLATSSRCAIELIREVGEINSNKSLWELAISVLLDHSEASIVRENAANLLANLTTHTAQHSNSELISTLIPHSLKKNSSTFLCLLAVLDDFKFFGELEPILASLYLKTRTSDSPKDSKRSSTSSSLFSQDISPQNCATNTKSSDTIITPSLLRSVALFIHNLLALSREDIIIGLNECGLVKLFFRCLSCPLSQFNTTRDLALYCDMLEMNASICTLLSRAIGEDRACLGMILQTRDCLNVMLSLLDPQLYLTDSAQLVFLRNQLWAEIFGLMGTLLNDSSGDGEEYLRVNIQVEDALTVISLALNECGHQAFLQTLCEAISSDGSEDLQLSALNSLTSLLRIEARSGVEELNLPDDTNRSGKSIQSLLDTCRTPRSLVAPKNTPSNTETSRTSPTSKISPRDKLDVLRDVYFGAGDSGRSGSSPGASQSLPDQQDNELPMAGAELCRILLNLYDVCCLDTKKPNRKRTVVIRTLTSLLCVSREAKRYALRCGLVEMLVSQLKDLHVRLSLESVDGPRRLGERRRVAGPLREVANLVGLATNFMVGDGDTKCAFAATGFADVVHKLWAWFAAVDRVLLIDALKMLSTYTNDCTQACQSLSMTCSVAGSAPRKAPSSTGSLLGEIVSLVCREMELISRMHDLTVLELCFHVLHNSCVAVECRSSIVKSNLLHCLLRLHPAITKRQKPWESVEILWINFLLRLTVHPEGQICLAKSGDTLELILALANNGNNRRFNGALLIVRNLSFHQQNRARFLNSEDFVNLLTAKLSQNATVDEWEIATTIVWALCANNQRAKLVLKSASIDACMHDCLRRLSLSGGDGGGDYHSGTSEVFERMKFVYAILKDGDKSK